MRQDCTNGDQIIEVSKHLITVSMERADWATVEGHVLKVLDKADAGTTENDRQTQLYGQCILGLANLHDEKYHKAAGWFLKVNPGMVAGDCKVMSPTDVAVYGALCSLATMDRGELQRRVLNNSNFRTYLELEPHLRKAVTFFVNGRYSLCLNILESYRNDYLLDIHLSRHVKGLFARIRSTCIHQYFIPFSVVTLDSLNTAFAVPDKTIDDELIEMIRNGELEARIDTQNRVNSPVTPKHHCKN
jgi:COP9 signalosome complex subunit 1